MINIQKLLAKQTQVAKVKDLIPLANEINTIATPIVEPASIPCTPLICSVDMVIPAYTSAIVSDYFFIPYQYTLTIEQGAIFRIL